MNRGDKNEALARVRAVCMAFPETIERLEGELEALLVDEAPDEEHELLLRRGELRAQRREVADGLHVAGIDPVGDHGHSRLGDAEDVGDVPAHVVRADDHRIGAAPVYGIASRILQRAHPYLSGMLDKYIR